MICGTKIRTFTRATCKKTNKKSFILQLAIKREDQSGCFWANILISAKALGGQCGKSENIQK